MASRRDSGGQVVIKKYGNRRLYDTSQSRYITLEDLAAIVKTGATVKVVEASTDRDLTRQVLTQVILEQQESLDMVPIELLHALIRMRGTLEQAPFSAFLSAATRQFASSGNLWSQQMASLFGGFPAGSQAETTAPPSPSPATAAEPAPGRVDPQPALAAKGPPNMADAVESGESPVQAEDDPSNVGDIRKRMDALLGKLGKS